MLMKTIYAFIMGLFFITIPVYAQDQPSGGEHQLPSAADIVAKMQSKLNLTQDQIAAVSPIIEKYTSKREVLRQSMLDGTADKDSMRSQMKQLKEDEKQELSQVLSADQLGQWEQMQSRRKHSDGQSQPDKVEGTGNIGAGNIGGGEAGGGNTQGQ